MAVHEKTRKFQHQQVNAVLFNMLYVPCPLLRTERTKQALMTVFPFRWYVWSVDLRDK